MPNPSQEHPASSKAPNQDLWDWHVLCTFKIKIRSKHLEHGCTKDQWPYPDQDRDAKPHWGTSRPKSGLKGHGCSLHLQNQDRKLKFGPWVYERPVIISKSRSRFPTLVKHLLHPRNPQSRTGHGCSLHFQNLDREPKFGSWVYQRPVTTSKSRSRC